MRFPEGVVDPCAGGGARHSGGTAVTISRGLPPQTSSQSAPHISPASAQAHRSRAPTLTATMTASAAGRKGTGNHARGSRDMPKKRAVPNAPRVSSKVATVAQRRKTQARRSMFRTMLSPKPAPSAASGTNNGFSLVNSSAGRFAPCVERTAHAPALAARRCDPGARADNSCRSDRR